MANKWRTNCATATTNKLTASSFKQIAVTLLWIRFEQPSSSSRIFLAALALGYSFSYSDAFRLGSIIKISIKQSFLKFSERRISETEQRRAYFMPHWNHIVQVNCGSKRGHVAWGRHST